VATPRRTLLAGLAVLLVVGASLLGATAAQAQTSPTTPTTASQKVSEGSTREERLAGENRRMVAVIGGLVVVAIALTLLTIRYVRATKPQPRAPAPVGRHVRTPAAAPAGPAASAAAADPVPPAASAPSVDPVAPAAPADPVGSAPSGPPTGEVREASPADHGAADADYEPQGTGEHDRVEVPATAALPRPRRADRAAALGRSRG
jgi:hypothetical protein